MISKYQNDFALWNLIEILSFGDFLKFYEFYFERYPCKKYKKLHSLGYCVRILRNAAAHNNCILNTIKSPYDNNFQANKQIQTFLAKIPNIPKSARKKLSSNPTLHDFIALILLFDQLCMSKAMRRAKQREILSLLKRFKKNKDFFMKNNFIVSYFLAFQTMVYFVFFKSYVSEK